GLFSVLAIYLPSTASGAEAPSLRRPIRSDTFLPRLEAIWRGDDWTFRASKVARIMLYGFDEPVDLPTTSWTPRVSRTARIGPPAMTPVPGGAARIMILPAPQRPLPSWCRVRFSRSGTLIMVFLASSVALRMASGTSRALP